MTGAVAERLWKEVRAELEVLEALEVPRARMTAGEPLEGGDDGAVLGPASPRARAGGQREMEASAGASTGRDGEEMMREGEESGAAGVASDSGAGMMIICLSGPLTPPLREEHLIWRASFDLSSRKTD